MFQVFGDKEVLDAYDEAKRHQRDTEVELQRFEAELESSKTNLEGLRLRAANYHQWENLNKERRDLQEEILPTLQYHEMRDKAALESKALHDAKKSLLEQDMQLSDKRGDLAQRANALSAAQQHETTLETEKSALETRLSELNGKLKPQENLLEQKARLQKLAADAGADIADVAAALEQKEADYLRLRQTRDTLTTRVAADRTAIAALESKAALPEPDNVRAMRRALREAGIAHLMLPDIIEVADPRWQGAVEGVLRSYAFVVLLEKGRDAAAAYRLGEKERYGHFIVPECVTAPSTKDQSLLSVVRFSAPAPSWLIDQLARITRVDSAGDGTRPAATTQ